MMKTIFQYSAATLLLFSAATAAAQDFSIDWYTIDGGGGTSTGGGFELSGTIGQPDAGFASGGGYELDGGFWTFSAQGPPPPCVGDIAPPGGDGNVDGGDLNVLLSNWGCPDPLNDCQGSDLNLDGDVGGGDLNILLSNWGPCN